MADAIDYAARHLEGTLTHQAKDGVVFPPDYPWEGLAIDLFQELATRGFRVERVL